ncbi:uncharacterized protein LOC130765261 [Actinidia eriantha]|uniref:uncharacterized protein LOC130765164 n=1 Tax=Actinidia eriantha TaxID=165200 RepID=UPI00258637D3|nr:uncharacterized protein LOC130765164 [Actinidia eriantha]XP_057477618.1 uncharacterized protein LOC130765261 [Actinidia eriantha]
MGDNMIKGWSWIILALLVVVVVVGWEARMAIAAQTPAQCKEERRVGINACKQVVYGKLPTPECCERIRASHFECMCPVITPKLAALIDVNRFVRLIQGCGKKVPRHFKCGSITTP